MSPRSCSFALLVCLLGAAVAQAQMDKIVLRVEPGGPNSDMTAVAFSPDGERLYATGFDKVVRVWARQQGTFVLSKIVYRVPVGPGMAGVLNALAVAPDGNWLAVGGVGVMRGTADYRSVGSVFPSQGARDEEMDKDEGTITVFNVNNERQLKVLRGQAGTIRALAFLPARDGKSLLVSAAEEPGAKPDSYRVRVRLWDVATATSLADKIVDTQTPRRRPALAAWHTGPNARDVAVALASPDGQVRVWDVAGGRVQDDKDGQFNNTTAPGAEAGSFWTTSFRGTDGVIRLWRTEGGRPVPAAAEIRLAAEDPQSGPFLIPFDLTTFPARPGGVIDRAAVLARRQGARAADDDRDILFVLDLPNRKILARYPVGTFRSTHSTLRRVAASPTGAFIGIADSDHQQVLVLSTVDLIERPGAARRQELRGVGTSFQAVAFRKKGADRALALEETAGNPLLFDFAQRRLSADAPGWLKDAPDTTGWDVKPSQEKDYLVYTVSSPSYRAKRVILDGQPLPTAHALLPPRQGQPFGPLLAVAWLDDFKQPWLALYDVNSGAQVRQLAGHVGAVHSLAFSGDGQLLASAAADHTVCLWSMTSLGQVLGKAGALPQVVVVPQGNALKVAQAPADSPLKEGTLVEGFVVDGKLQGVTAPLAFYQALFARQPGTTLVLRARLPGAGAAADVTLPVGQGTDERSPLLSLFVTRGGKPGERHWIGWTSQGPYDVSSPLAEEYLGWHFNPVDRASPIAFVGADKYRKDYYLRGVLEHVVHWGNTSKGVEEYKKVPARLNGWIDGIDPDSARIVARPLVRTRNLTLWLEMEGRFPLERVNALRWRMDQGPWHDRTEFRERSWSVDLARTAWGRGPHRIEAQMEIEGGIRQVEWSTSFHYLPRPPLLALSRDWLAQHPPDADGLRQTKDAVFPVEAEATPGTAGETVRITLRHNGKPLPVEGTKLHQSIALVEGTNTIEIGADNVGSSPDLKDQEMAEPIVLKVLYHRLRPAPTIAFRAVVPVAKNAVPLLVRLGQPIHVSVSKVQIVGRVTGEENLLEALRDGQPLRGFQASTKPQFDFAEEVVLKPGVQELHFAGRSAHSPRGEDSLRIEYQPPVARIHKLRRVDEAQDLSRAYQSTIQLEAELEPPAQTEPYTAELLVNGKAPIQQRLEAAATSFKSKAALDPGVNRIVLRLHNAWGAATQSELLVRYLRPPILVKIDVPREVDKAVMPADFRALVDSPAELPPNQARLNDKVYRDDRLQAELLDRRAGRWRVTLRDVELQEGDNSFTLFVANRDEESKRSLTALVRYTKPKPPKPVITFRDGFKNGEAYPVPTPEYTLAFVVESRTPLARVELRGAAGTVLQRATGDDLKRGRVEAKWTVRLEPGKPTLYHVLAGNDGGDQEVSVTLTVPQRPAYVVIERLESVQAPAQEFPCSEKNDADGRTVFKVAAEGQAKLHGKVYWNDPSARKPRTNLAVRVYANGFQQLPVETQPLQDGSFTFTAIVLLTRAEHNIIEIDLPDVKMANGQRNSAVVERCTHPIQGRRLHLVVVGIGEKDGTALKDRALAAIGARSAADDPERLQAPPAFELVKVYPPLVEEVSPYRVRARLLQVKRQIEAAGGEGRDVVLSEVVLLYYHGQEVVTPQGDYLLTDESAGDPDPSHTGVKCQDIVDLFRGTQGAQVVMLDMERVAADRAEVRTFEGTRVGLFHSLWPGQAKVPADRFLEVLKDSWAQADTLGTLATEVERLARRLAPGVEFYRYLPGELALLQFGGKPMK